MRKIELTRGEFAIVDECDYEHLSKWKWHYCHHYAARSTPRDTRGRKTMVYMHRVVLERMGCVNFQHTDHVNHDRLDNRRNNLRPATCSQNIANSRFRSGSSKYQGVSWDWSRDKWQAQIRVQRVNKALGRFDDELEAARAYNRAALKAFGEFATLNEVPNE